MTHMTVLDLNNCNLTGTLPAGWAANMPALNYINVSSNYLTGVWLFPPVCLLCIAFLITQCHLVLLCTSGDCGVANAAGTLPPEWSTLNLTKLNLDRNMLTGDFNLPFPHIEPFVPKESLQCLQPFTMPPCANTGSIPTTWGTNGSFPNIIRLQLFANHLSGSLPAGYDLSI